MFQCYGDFIYPTDFVNYNYLKEYFMDKNATKSVSIRLLH